MEMTRRSFVGAAVAASVTPSSALAEDKAFAKDEFEGETANIPPVEPPASYDYEADIVVIGAGGGLSGRHIVRQKGHAHALLYQIADSINQIFREIGIFCQRCRQYLLSSLCQTSYSSCNPVFIIMIVIIVYEADFICQRIK